MGLFNWFGDQEHRVFNYRPVYYDEEKEELRRKFGAVDGSQEKDGKDGTYVPGSYIQGSFRSGNYARRKGGSRVQVIIGIITLILIAVMLVCITRFYSLL